MAEWYDSGSLAVEEGSVSIVGTETLFMTRAKDGDMLVTFQGGNLRINQVVAREDDNHLTIAPPWSGDTDSGLVYYLVPTGPGWNDISSVARDLATFLATRASFFPTEGKPAADIGGNGSFAIDANASPPLLYSKTAGSWDDGKSLGGPVGAPGKGFGGTSSDSKTIANSGSMSFSTQAGLAWQQGSRMRIASTTAPTTKWMEGVVTSYSGPTLVLTVDRQGTGSGSASDWTFSAAGIPGEKGDAPKFSGTSTSSKTIATGSVTVSTQSDLAFGLGSRVMLASAANTANFMSGPVTAYASGSMSVNVDFTGGSGTFSDWVITLAGARGATGAAAKNFAATSTTSRAIGSTGTMTWTIGNDKAYQVNDLVRLCVADDPTKWMKGIVSDYSGGVLSVAINEKSGTGTYANWTINLAGETGGKGDKGDRGAPLVPRGNYADDAIYQVLDIVANAGSTWIYINETPGSGHAPPTIPTTENTYWRLLARRGEDGTDGTSFAPDYRGTFSDRSTYDTADAGKAYLSIDGDGDEITSAVLFFKKSSTSGDWSEPTQFQGPKGDGGASATVEVGDVTTLAAGEEATVENVGTESAARFNFGIPQGDKGDPGTTDYMALDNRPTLGSAAAANTEDFATAAQGSKADTAVQSDALGTAAELDIDTDVTLSANSDDIIASQKAVKGYVDDGLNSRSSFRNRIVNPCGAITQAGLANTSDGNYTGFDQWLALTQSNAVTPSQLTAVADGIPTMMRMDQANASAQRMGWLQPLESRMVADLRSKTVALQFVARMSVATTLRYAIIEWTGTADTITKDVVSDWTKTTFTAGQFFAGSNLTIAAAGSKALSSNALTTVDLSGQVSSSMNNILIFVWTDSAQAQNVKLDLGNVFFGQGAAAPSTFEPPTHGGDLRQCRRYYEKSYELETAPGSVAADGAEVTFIAAGLSTAAHLVGVSTRMSEHKRVLPTLTFYSASTGASGKAAEFNSGTDVAVTATRVSKDKFGWYATAPSASGFNLQVQWTADARL